MSNKKNEEPEFDEVKALEELQGYIVIALQTQNFEFLERQIESWKRKYPLDKFKNMEVLRKVKTILSRDFLSRILGDYLASKILQDKQRQLEAYESLKKIIDDAEKSDNNDAYKVAEQKIKRWKAKLKADEMSLYGFDRYYRSKIFKLLIIPRNKIKEGTDATRELKQLYEKGKTLSSKEFATEITKWQDRYCVENFKKGLRAELNDITASIFKSIADKRDEESCIKELNDFSLNTSLKKPVDKLASILSKYEPSKFSKDTQNRIEKMMQQYLHISDSLLNEFDQDPLNGLVPVATFEQESINELRKILKNNPRNMSAILEWMYKTSKYNFSKETRQKIVDLFLATKIFKLKEQASYSIPMFDVSFLNNDRSTIRANFINIVQNYIGIMSTGKVLTKTEKGNLAGATFTSYVNSAVEPEDPLSDARNSSLDPSTESHSVLPQPEELNVEPNSEGKIVIEVVPNGLKEPASKCFIPVFDTISNEPEAAHNDEPVIESDFFTSKDSYIVPINQYPNKDTLLKKDTSKESPDILFVIPVHSNLELEQSNEVKVESDEKPIEETPEYNTGYIEDEKAEAVEEEKSTLDLPEQEQEAIACDYRVILVGDLSYSIIQEVNRQQTNKLSFKEREDIE